MKKRTAKLTEEVKDAVIRLRDEGLLQKDIADRVGLSQTSVSTIIRECDFKVPPASILNKNSSPEARYMELDIPSLPDNYLFKHINWAIP